MKKLTIIFFFCVLSLCVMAQDVQLLNDTVEHNLNGLTTQSYTLTTPIGRVTFLAKHSARATSIDPLGTLTVQQNVNNKWETIYEGNPGVVTVADRVVLGAVLGQYEASVAYESFSFAVNPRATELKFVGNALNNKQIKNVCTYMASFIELSPANLYLGELEVDAPAIEKTFMVEHCNVARLNVTSTNPEFVPSVSTLVNSGVGQYAKETVTVSFSANVMGLHTATIIVSNGTQTDSIHCSAKVTKKNPVLTWKAPETITVGEVVTDPVESTCSNDFALVSCSENVQIVCGEIRALAEGEATIEVMQLGDDDYWNNKVEEFTITVVAPILTAAPSNRTDATAQKTVRNGMVYVEANNNLYHISGQQQ